MPQGDKSSYTNKQKRQAEHIEESYESRGVGAKESKKRAWATVNKTTHGGKKSGYFQFVSSDPDMLLFMMRWAEKYLFEPKSISRKEIKFRLFIHEPNKGSNIEDFWARTLFVKKNMFKTTKIRGRGMHKNQNYKGSCMIYITSIGILRKVLAWQNQLIKYYKDIDRARVSKTEMHP